jgi:solute carrier family 10 (sodium/bile acid cotransporter), member 7
MIKKYWFFIGIACVMGIAFTLPEVGRFVRTYRILNMGIFVAFFLTGLSLETSSFFEQLKNIKVLVAALVSSLIFFPVVAYFLGQYIFSGWVDFAIGTLIIGVAPVTVASGTVMTAIALGNVPLSLFICVLGNFFSILTIPIMINLMLQMGDVSIDLPALQMLLGLTLKVLVPILAGQLLRPMLQSKIVPYKKLISIFNQCIVLLIILNAVSSSSHRIIEAGPALFLVFLFMIGLHIFIILVNKSISGLIGLDLPSTAAFTIHTSQKTLTISYLVWAGYFAVEYPMALIPGIAYHLTQMIMDTFVAQWFRVRIESWRKSCMGADGA